VFGPAAGLPAAAGAILGHLYPVWLQFRGGKGVATFLGGLIGMAWPAALAFALVWLAVAYLTRYSSAAALAATLVAPIAAWSIGLPEVAYVFALLAAIVWFKHSANIRRLLAGTESKIGQA
jgi:glycerol-3-phosphate acyltransferase PlsY